VDDAEAARLRTVFARRRPLLEEVATSLCDLAETGLSTYDHRHVDRIYFRAKSVESFVNKVRKRAAAAAAGEVRDGFPLVAYRSPLTQVEDQVGGRVLVLFHHDIERVIRLLLTTFNAMEMQDKTPPKDAEFGYESTHLVCQIPDHLRPSAWSSEGQMPETFELQVRTLFMHAWAEPQHDLGYKGPGDLTKLQKKRLAWIAASAWGADRGLGDLWDEVGLSVHGHSS
jgi:putative GTP pyrophosphokinase